MRSAILDFNRACNETKIDSSVRNKVVSAAIAQMLANQASVPSSAVEDPSKYYNDSVRPMVTNGIGLFNENTLIDVDLTTRLARAFWMIRYTASQPSNKVFPIVGLPYFQQSLGVLTYMSPDELKLLNENAFAILRLTNYALSCHLAMND